MYWVLVAEIYSSSHTTCQYLTGTKQLFNLCYVVKLWKYVWDETYLKNCLSPKVNIKGQFDDYTSNSLLWNWNNNCLSFEFSSQKKSVCLWRTLWIATKTFWTPSMISIESNFYYLPHAEHWKTTLAFIWNNLSSLGN